MSDLTKPKFITAADLPKKPGTGDIDYAKLTPDQCKALWDAEEAHKARFKKFTEKHPLDLPKRKRGRPRRDHNPFPDPDRIAAYVPAPNPETVLDPRPAVLPGNRLPGTPEPPLADAAGLPPVLSATVANHATTPGQPTLYSLRAEWELLKDTADTHFPPELIQGRCTPSQRLVAIAHCLGWTYEEIRLGSGIAKRTVLLWMARPDVKRFVEDFNLHAGTKPVLERVDKLQFAALTVIERLMMDKLSPPKVRFQAAAWLFERKHGSAVQKIDARVGDIRTLTERLMQTDIGAPSPQDYGLDPEADNEPDDVN